MSKSLAEYLAEVRQAIPAKDQPIPSDTGTTAPITIDLTEYRTLTTEERSFLTWLLEHSDPSAEAFLPQLDGLLVMESCSCGCPTLSMHVAGDDRLVKSSRYTLVDLIGRADGHLVGVILSQKGGRLVGLEVFDIEGSDGKFGVPDVSTLHPFEAGPSSQ